MVHPVMRLLVYRLHEKGCPLNYGQVLTRSKLAGNLAFERVDVANQVARLYRDDGGQRGQPRMAFQPCVDMRSCQRRGGVVLAV